MRAETLLEGARVAVELCNIQWRGSTTYFLTRGPASPVGNNTFNLFNQNI